MDHSYFELGGPDDGKEKASFYVLDSLLKSRVECGFGSESHELGENINVYLVHLLSSLIGAPDLGELAAHREIDVFKQVKDSTDPRFKMQVYRTKADHLLVSTGIFGDTPYVEHEGQRIFRGRTRVRIGRGKAYYHYAAAYHSRTAARDTVLPAVLALLSQDFERYVDVLFHMRGEYFHLFERMREEHLMAMPSETPPSGEVTGEVTELGALRDDFLDAYWIYQNKPDDGTRDSLAETVKRLRAVDPTFDFEVPEN
ncbi:MAG: hypothetical protein HKN12_08615 [Gemmatimonadetes bacterium]|nr:hypothetical protein [Gemmatimonadota bacterium]